MTLPEGSVEDTMRCDIAPQYEIVGVRGIPKYKDKRTGRPVDTGAYYEPRESTGVPELQHTTGTSLVLPAI
jgi:hypothetical protein